MCYMHEVIMFDLDQNDHSFSGCNWYFSNNQRKAQAECYTAYTAQFLHIIAGIGLRCFHRNIDPLFLGTLESVCMFW